MKIFVATHSRGALGGIESYLQSVIPALSQAGHRVTLGYERDAGVPFLSIPAVREIQLVPGWIPSAADAERPDVVFLHGVADAGCEARLVGWAPTAYFAHNFWGICISGTKRWGWPRARVCTKPFGPSCLVHYLPHRCGGLNPAVAVRYYLEHRHRLKTLRRCEALIVASRYMAEEYVRNGVPRGRMHVLPPALLDSAEQASTHRASHRLASEIRLLFVGRLTSLKGLGQLIDATRLLSRQDHRRWVVVIAGSGPEWPSLQERARKSGVLVEYHGWVAPEARDRLIARATLLVLPSTWPEPFGLVGLEAARLGLPSVAFPVGGIPEWLESGVNGELAREPGAAAALADALARAVSSAAHYERLCRGALERASAFGKVRHLAALSSILRTAAGGGSREPASRRHEPT